MVKRPLAHTRSALELVEKLEKGGQGSDGIGAPAVSVVGGSKEIGEVRGGAGLGFSRAGSRGRRRCESRKRGARGGVKWIRSGREEVGVVHEIDEEPDDERRGGDLDRRLLSSIGASRVVGTRSGGSKHAPEDSAETVSHLRVLLATSGPAHLAAFR